MPNARTLAARFREGNDFRCAGRYRSRETVQAWVVACAAKHPLGMLDVYRELAAVSGGGYAAEKFRELCVQFEAEVTRVRAGAATVPPGR